MKQIKNIIFDVGNVLFKYYPEHIIKSLLPNTKYTTFYLDVLFNAEVWQQLDKGILNSNSAIEYISKYNKLAAEQICDIKLLIDSFYKYLILDNDMKQLFIESTKKFNVYILSNFQYDSFLKLKDQHSFLNLAKGEVVSANVKMIKPELGIFHYLLSQEKILPEESIFIDDMKDNVTAAKTLLINTIHHESYKRTLLKLHKQNIKILK